MSKAKEIKNQIITDSYFRKRIFKIMLSLVILLVVSYGYLIVSITFNTQARKSLTNNIRDLESKVGQLELSYLNISESVNKDMAFSMGFIEAKDVFVVTRTLNSFAIK